ncbi:MFS transporter [Rodentibacter myodis]|uniref:MFS transporter n=1 Tax=Rodentibacter myodis TaxID=1907939 RepID=A0A1V3JS76_9PAST|nr:MFS transporter [Rodentibacter myodis]OOF59640.1 MFS transporter [Rodentibacter myodis]
MNTQDMILWRKFFSGLAYTAMQSVFFVYLQYYKGFEADQITTSFSVLVFASQAFSLFAGAWGDRFGRSWIMMLGCILDATAYILLLTTHSYPLLLVATLFFGLGSTLFSTNARAFLLEYAQNNYTAKARAQGKFLRISSLASMVAPLVSLPFVYYRKAEWLIWLSCAIEISMVLVMAKTLSFKTECAAIVGKRFHFRDIKAVLTKRFISAHLLLFIPLGLGTAFYVIFPYIFTNLLDRQELVSIAFFINNLIAVLLQPYFSRRINFGITKMVFIAPILIILLLLPWFYSLQYLSIVTAFLYLGVFAIVSLFANTALANILVRLDKGENQGLMFGTSKMILALTTTGVMNALPYVFLL